VIVVITGGQMTSEGWDVIDRATGVSVVHVHRPFNFSDAVNAGARASGVGSSEEAWAGLGWAGLERRVE
jgi:hypothetical protein